MHSRSHVLWLSLLHCRALILQKADPAQYDGDGTSHLSTRPGANVVCECCWRDCDWKENVTQRLARASSSVANGMAGSMRLLPGAVPLPTEPIAELSKVDAWLMVHLRAQDDIDWNMWTPILETVKSAVEAYGSVARIVRFSEINNVLNAIQVAVAEGRRPFVFTVAHEFTTAEERTIATMRQAKLAGAYIIQYQAEPAGPPDQFGKFWLLERALNFSAEIGSDEVWDYTYANIDNYPHRTTGPIIRFVPPGYVTKLDVGVDMNSYLSRPQMIGYMGSMVFKTMNETYADQLADRLHVANDIWSNSDLKTYLDSYPIQLIQHRFQKEWDVEHQHAEAFRLAALLANKACVISAPSNSKDVVLWRRVVTFVDVNHTAAAMAPLAKHINDCRTHSYLTFKRDFAARKLLQGSGFFQAWRPPHGK